MTTATTTAPIRARVDALDWDPLRDDRGFAVTPILLDVAECAELAGLFDGGRLRSVLSESGVDFDGGELVLLAQRPRAQSRAHVLAPPRGAFVVFPTRHRPQQGARGHHRVGVRHGVSTVTRGSRVADRARDHLHDAR